MCYLTHDTLQMGKVITEDKIRKGCSRGRSSGGKDVLGGVFVFFRLITSILVILTNVLSINGFF